MSLIPGGANTASKSPSRYVKAHPKYASHGFGCRLWVVGEPHPYLDFGMGLGACVLGYAHPAVRNAAFGAISAGGPVFTLASNEEERAAIILLHYIPWAEQVRFAKNGTDVTTAAVRLARHATGRTQVASVGYHGWADWSLGPPAYGVYDQQTEHVEWPWLPVTTDIAALVVEVAPEAVPDDAPLTVYREWCDKHGVVLVFDEVLSGFRYRMGSASDVVPDLACFGKSIGNGYPISALVGKTGLMKHLEPGGVFFSGTAFGDTVSLAVMRAVLRYMDDHKIPEFLTAQGRKLMDGFNDARTAVGFSPRDISCQGEGARSMVRSTLPNDRMDVLQQECARRQMLFNGSHILSEAHNDEAIERAISIYGEALREVADGASLEGDPPIKPYRVQ